MESTKKGKGKKNNNKLIWGLITIGFIGTMIGVFVYLVTTGNLTWTFSLGSGT